MTGHNHKHLLTLAHQYMDSRPAHFTAEAVFSIPQGVCGGWVTRCRVVFCPPGVVRVFAEATGELLAETSPGLPLVPALGSPHD